MPSPGDWEWSRHALSRALDMAVDAKDLRAVLSDPQVKTCGGPEHPEGREIWARGKIAIVVIPETRVVCTVLWRGRDYVRGEDEEFFRD